jgi:transposase
MQAYSYDLRQRILRAVDQRTPRAEIVQTFAVSRSTIKRSLTLRRATGDVKPKAIPGRPSKKGAALDAGLPSQLEAYPDATLDEHCQMWEATYGIPVSSATMSRAIRRLNWTRKKKTIRASEQNEAERAAWREQAKQLPTQDLVIVDETRSRINLTPLYAYAPRGKRAIGTVPRNCRIHHNLRIRKRSIIPGENLVMDRFPVQADEKIPSGFAFVRYLIRIAPSSQSGCGVALASRSESVQPVLSDGDNPKSSREASPISAPSC